MNETRNDVVEQLAASRELFLSFVSHRVGDEQLAEDILQTSLLKASENFGRLESEEKLIPWFYAILRNQITDHYRRRARYQEQSLPPELDLEDEVEVERQLCECFRPLLSTLKPEYAELIEADLNEETPAVMAGRLGLSPANLKVRRHRARQALRRLLEETCRVCATHHCMDCSCSSENLRD
jgi:RNA polymerase sigma-70 factor (ECF subfamily)